jgi:hypothetical protein
VTKENESDRVCFVSKKFLLEHAPYAALDGIKRLLTVIHSNVCSVRAPLSLVLDPQLQVQTRGIIIYRALACKMQAFAHTPTGHEV